MDFDFYRYHALGNDYLVIDPNRTQMTLTAESVKLICDRHYGIGSDGILFGPLFEGETIRLRIFNPDGSEAEKSGNGIRIFSRYLRDAGYVTSSSFAIKTKGGTVAVELLDNTGSTIRVDMGTVTFQSDLIPVAGETREVIDEPFSIDGQTYRITGLSIGNPHCVVPVEKASKQLALTLGPLIERHPLFPNRTNVQFLQTSDRKNITIEIWERGAGYTMASGSSSCAAASAAFRLGLVDRSVDVHMPGGVIHIDIDENGHVYMTGPVTGIARGIFHDDLRTCLGKQN